MEKNSLIFIFLDFFSHVQCDSLENIFKHFIDFLGNKNINIFFLHFSTSWCIGNWQICRLIEQKLKDFRMDS